MKRWAGALTLLLTVGWATPAWAVGSIRLAAYPAISVADGRSTITITAEVRTSSGSKAADGTVVRFSTNLGTFREVDVSTIAGVARAVLVAPSIPGVAKVSVSVPGVATSTLDIEFVKDRSVLASARQHLEIVGPEYLAYHPDLRLVSATGSDRGAWVKYRDIRIESDDMQVNLSTLWVVAINAKLTVGDKSLECPRLKYSLNRRQGTAITTADGRPGFYGLTAAEPGEVGRKMAENEFEFEDVGLASTSVHGDRIIAFPNREIQFHRARLYVGDVKVMSMPLYSMRANTEPGSLGDNVVSYANGGLVIDYPYYVKLSPSQTSVFRLRSGQSYGRGATASGGVFLDWENKYSRGDSIDGSVVLAGIGRKDMGLSWRHTQRFDSRTTMHAFLDFPSFRTMYGALNASRGFDGFSVNLTGSSMRSLRGNTFESQRLDLSAETNMKRLGNLPLNYTVGVTANTSRAVLGTTRTSQEGFGLRSRLVLLPQPLWEGANLSGAVTVSKLWGTNTGSGPGILGTLTVATPFGRNGSFRFSYDYAQDPFTSSLTGKHRVNAELYFDAGDVSLSLFGAKGLDLDSTTFYADGYLNVSGLWRIGTLISYDRFIGSTVTDETMILGYLVGMREIRLTYSRSTGRFGFELVNAPFR
ncbi:MAG: hypothetical protein IH851_01150 [Armatimonadetes bacterium]|nr:hypothetical protein [Armatimonadota bacterium]